MDVRPLLAELQRAFPRAIEVVRPPDAFGSGLSAVLKLQRRAKLTVEVFGGFEAVPSSDLVPSKVAPKLRRVPNACSPGPTSRSARICALTATSIRTTRSRCATASSTSSGGSSPDEADLPVRAGERNGARRVRRPSARDPRVRGADGGAGPSSCCSRAQPMTDFARAGSRAVDESARRATPACKPILRHIFTSPTPPRPSCRASPGAPRSRAGAPPTRARPPSHRRRARAAHGASRPCPARAARRG